MVDEDEANAVDKKLNESSVLQDAVMVMVIVVEAIMKLTLVMQMMVDKEVDVKLDWEVDDEIGVAGRWTKRCSRKWPWIFKVR